MHTNLRIKMFVPESLKFSEKSIYIFLNSITLRRVHKMHFCTEFKLTFMSFLLTFTFTFWAVIPFWLNQYEISSGSTYHFKDLTAVVFLQAF